MEQIKTPFKSLAEWRSAHRKYYKYAVVHGFIDEICEQVGWEKPTRTPLGYWNNRERCMAEAKKYNTKNEWSLCPNGSAQAARRNGWYEECTAHMSEKFRWTEQNCLEDALRFKNVKEWQRESESSYQAARLGGWLEMCTLHMDKLKIAHTKEGCIEDARQFETKMEWRKESNKFYQIAKKRGWFNECTAHMVDKFRWTKENCQEDASKYNTRTEWARASGSGYNTAMKNGWFEDCVTHMDKINKPHGYWTKERCMKVAQKHKTPVEWKNAGGGSRSAATSNDWYEECTAHMSKRNVDYKAHVIEKKPTGFWNIRENCLVEAKKYTTPTQWNKTPGDSYSAAIRNGWYRECVEHMVIKTRCSWVKEECISEAQKYNTPTEWVNKSGSSYRAARKNGWFGECTTHMTSLQKPSGYWVKEKCVEEALKYDISSEWRKHSPSSYSKAKKNDWFAECTAHMSRRLITHTKETCLTEAGKYKTRGEWAKKAKNSYQKASKEGWLGELCVHMGNGRVRTTKEMCMEDATHYQTRNKWKKESRFYHAAARNGWLDDCCIHMHSDIGSKLKWTLEYCKKVAAQYHYKKDWLAKDTKTYQAARRNGWLAECTAHMTKRGK